MEVVSIEFSTNKVILKGNWNKANNEPTMKAVPLDKVILEQYTGLKDKNGKEIYVGDVVQIPGERASIVFDEKKASYMGRFLVEYGNRKIESNDYIFDFCPNDIEAIGNVHQNPELLEGM